MHRILVMGSVMLIRELHMYFVSLQGSANAMVEKIVLFHIELVVIGMCLHTVHRHSLLYSCFRSTRPYYFVVYFELRHVCLHKLSLPLKVYIVDLNGGHTTMLKL